MVLPGREIARRMGRTVVWDDQSIRMEHCGTIEWRVAWAEIERLSGRRSGPMHMHGDTLVTTRQGTTHLIPLRWGSPMYRADPLWEAIAAHVPPGVAPPNEHEYTVVPTSREVRTLFVLGIAATLYGAIDFPRFLYNGPFSAGPMFALMIGPALTAAAAMAAWRRARRR